MKPEIEAALKAASTLCHRITMAMATRKLIDSCIDTVRLGRLRWALEKQLMTDEEIGEASADAFEQLVEAMRLENVEGVTAFECEASKELLDLERKKSQ
jgi:hypothetical protein